MSSDRVVAVGRRSAPSPTRVDVEMAPPTRHLPHCQPSPVRRSGASRVCAPEARSLRRSLRLTSRHTALHPTRFIWLPYPPPPLATLPLTSVAAPRSTLPAPVSC